jgi:hypothetical protein
VSVEVDVSFVAAVFDAVVWVLVSTVLELIGVVVGVSVTTGVDGVSMTGAGVVVTGVVSAVATGVVSVTVLVDCVTVTSEPDFFGMRLTLVFVPMDEPLPAPPAELLVSTAAGPEIAAGVLELPTPVVFDGAGVLVPTTTPPLSADACCSVRIWP